MRSVALKALALAVLPLVLLLLWTFRRPPLPPPKTAGKGHAAVAEALPAAVGGWKRVGKLLRFDKKTLYDRINGAAPVYIKGGYQRSLGAEYRHPSIKEAVQVDFYVMGTTKEAEAIYTKEQDPEAKRVKVGQGGYLATGNLNFWESVVYVKIAGYDDGTDVTAQLTALGKGLAQSARKMGPPAKATKSNAPASQPKETP